MELRLSDLSEWIGATLDGDAGVRVSGVAPLYRAGPGEISFLSSARHRQALLDTRAGAVIVSGKLRQHCPVSALVCDNPELAFAKAAQVFAGERTVQPGIDGSAWVHPSVHIDACARVAAHCTLEEDVRIGPGADIGPGSYVGAGSRIGAGTVLVARVSVYPGVHVGERCLIHAGVVLGADGFGLARDGERWVKVPQLGSLRIGDDVEIGANTTIDRGAMDDTVIEDGVKLDNQIQIGHNCTIGAHTAMAGCSGVAGSTRIGRGCEIGGGACIGGHIELADGVLVGGMSGVDRTLSEPGAYASGMRVDHVDKWRRNSARFRQLDDIVRRVRALESRLDDMKDDEGS